MKRKSEGKSAADVAGEHTSNYAVGQVSDCLFPSTPTPASGSLSALFSTNALSNTVVFVPAPKPEPKPVQVEKTALKTVKEQTKKSKKTKSDADSKLLARESALQNADEVETGADIQKKAAKRKAKTLADDDETKGVKTKPAKRPLTFKDRAAERVKAKRTVFVGNLPASCTKQELNSIFREYGEIESMRFRSVVREDPTISRKVAAIQRKVHPKKQNINAYIVFKDTESVEKAMTKNGMEIQKGFHIRVDKTSKQHDHKRSIFVGNLPYDVAELSLRQHFEDCGTVEAVRLIRDRDTGMGKGFGYVLFETPDAVQLALKLDGSTLCERKIRIKRSVQDSNKNRGPEGKKGKRKEAKATGKAEPQGDVTGGGKGAFKRKPRKTDPSTFKGEMTNPSAKKHKGQKKKFKPRKKKDFHL